MLSRYGTSEQRKAPQENKASSSNSKRWLFALIAVIGVVSLVGSFANLSSNQEEGIEAPVRTASMGAPVSRAMVEQHTGKPCELYAGGPIEKNKHIFVTPIDEKMILEFFFKIDATSPRFGNIVHVGNHNYNEWPSVYFTNWFWRGGPKLLIRFEKHGVAGFYDVEEEIQVDREYLLRIAIDGLQCQIFVDGVQKQDFAIPPQYKPAPGSSFPVYAAGDWSMAAGGTISTLALCLDGAEPPTEAPTPAPTSSPTPAPTGSPTPAPTGAPTPAPTGAPTPAPTSAPTPAPVAAQNCVTNAGPQSMQVDTVLMHVDIGQNYDLSYRATFANVAAIGHFMHVGTDSRSEGPIGELSSNRVYMVFDKPGGTQTNVYFDRNSILQNNVEAFFELQVRGTNVKVFIDGVLRKEQNINANSRLTGTNIPIHSGSPHWSDAVGTVRDVKYCVV